MIKTVLFDLDGTLLPMDQEIFAKAYFGGLARAAMPHGYDPNELTAAIWAGTARMVKNSGEATNETVFWKFFADRFGESALADKRIFDRFYEDASGFEAVRTSCGFNERSAELIKMLKSRGTRIVLATNPIFPAIATESRIRWAGLSPEDFELYTTYENSHYCKPNPEYYLEIIKKLGLIPEECIMVGNDVSEDMIASELGMKVFLLTDCLINKNGTDIEKYPHGGMDELFAFLENAI